MSLPRVLETTPFATLCYLVISLIPPVATFLYFWGLEYWKRLKLVEPLWIWIVFISGSYAILFPPELPEYLSIICGPGSVIHMIRAIELAFVLDVPTLKRLRRTKSSANALYAWESYPPPLTIRRGIWLIDLLTSTRGIGWSHGPRKHLPPDFLLDSRSVSQRQRNATKDQTGRTGKETFLLKKGIEIILCYIWIDFYQSIILHSQIWETLLRPVGWHYPLSEQCLFSWILTPWVRWIPAMVSIYAVIQLCCSMVAFCDIGLGLLGNEYWQYPPIFGPGINARKLSFKGIWGEWWHDLFRFTFLGIADWVIRASKVGERWENILVLGIPFLFYAAIHASLSYAISHDARASAWLIIFAGAQPLVILAQVRLRLVKHQAKTLMHTMVGLVAWLSTFGLVLGNPGVLHSLASFPIPISIWRKGELDVRETIVVSNS